MGLGGSSVGKFSNTVSLSPFNLLDRHPECAHFRVIVDTKFYSRLPLWVSRRVLRAEQRGVEETKIPTQVITILHNPQISRFLLQLLLLLPFSLSLFTVLLAPPPRPPLHSLFLQLCNRAHNRRLLSRSLPPLIPHVPRLPLLIPRPRRLRQTCHGLCPQWRPTHLLPSWLILSQTSREPAVITAHDNHRKLPHMALKRLRPRPRPDRRHRKETPRTLICIGQTEPRDEEKTVHRSSEGKRAERMYAWRLLFLVPYLSMPGISFCFVACMLFPLTPTAVRHLALFPLLSIRSGVLCFFVSYTCYAVKSQLHVLYTVSGVECMCCTERKRSRFLHYSFYRTVVLSCCYFLFTVLHCKSQSTHFATGGRYIRTQPYTCACQSNFCHMFSEFCFHCIVTVSVALMIITCSFPGSVDALIDSN